MGIFLVTVITVFIIVTLVKSTSIQKDLESRYNFTQLKSEIAKALSSSVNCTTSFKGLAFKKDGDFISAPFYYDDGAGNKTIHTKIIEENDLVDSIRVKRAGIEIITSIGQDKYKGKYVVELETKDRPLRAEFNLMFSTPANEKKISTCISSNLAANIGFCPPRPTSREDIGTWTRKKSGERWDQNGDPFAKLTKTYICPAKTVALTATFTCHYQWKWSYQDGNKHPIFDQKENAFVAQTSAIDPATVLVSCVIPRKALDECIGPFPPYDDQGSYASSCKLFKSWAEGSLTCCPTGE